MSTVMNKQPDIVPVGLRPDLKAAPTDDPLVGKKRTTDSSVEAAQKPDAEVELQTPPVGPAIKSRRLAGWLGILLGGLGIHRLYLGYHSIGLFQLVLFVVGVGISVVVATLRGTPVGMAALVALSAMSIVPLWGAIEGLAILLGGLDRDGCGRPLAA